MSRNRKIRMLTDPSKLDDGTYERYSFKKYSENLSRNYFKGKETTSTYIPSERRLNATNIEGEKADVQVDPLMQVLRKLPIVPTCEERRAEEERR